MQRPWQRLLNLFGALLLLVVVIAAFLSPEARSQTLAGERLLPVVEARGPYQHVVVGGSIAKSNGDLLPTAGGVVDLPVGSLPALGALFWMGSGETPDLDVTLVLPDGSENAISAPADACYTIDAGDLFDPLLYWQCALDVTVLVETLESLSGEYRIQDFVVDTGAPWRNANGFPQSVFAGSFALVLLYVDPADTYPRAIQVASGMLFSQTIGDHASEPLLPFEMTVNGGKATLVALEGDKEFPANGTCNGTVADAECDFFALCPDGCVDPAILPLDPTANIIELVNAQNPGGNVFNETVTTELASAVSGVVGEELNGLDIDTFDLAGRLPPQVYPSLYAAVQTGADAVIQAVLVVEVTDHDGDGDGLSNIQEEDETLTDPTDPDTDGDGLFDGIEVFGGNPADPKSSPTDPLNPDSDEDGLCDGAIAIDGVCFRGEDIDENGLWDGDETNPNDPDTDADGLSDLVEVRTGQYPGENGPRPDPLNPDSDGDGLQDGSEDVDHDGFWESANNETNPVDADTDHGGEDDGSERLHGRDPVDFPGDDNGALDDPDNDGLPSGTEETIGTGPLDPDSDDDGLIDGVEVNGANPTNPLDYDSDDDSLIDGDEDQNHTGGNDVGETDPNRGDTDGDGLTDDVELFSAYPHGQTSPTDADSDDDGLADGIEDASREGAFDPGETDPTDADTDDGTVGDGVEVDRGTDPLDPSDDLPPAPPPPVEPPRVEPPPVIEPPVTLTPPVEEPVIEEPPHRVIAGSAIYRACGATPSGEGLLPLTGLLAALALGARRRGARPRSGVDRSQLR